MTTLQSPVVIGVLIHCHCSRERHPDRSAPAIEEALAMLKGAGAIQHDSEAGLWRTTPLGSAWVKALTRVPSPTLQYVDADGQLLGEAPSL